MRIFQKKSFALLVSFLTLSNAFATFKAGDAVTTEDPHISSTSTSAQQNPKVYNDKELPKPEQVLQDFLTLKQWKHKSQVLSIAAFYLDANKQPLVRAILRATASNKVSDIQDLFQFCKQRAESLEGYESISALGGHNFVQAYLSCSKTQRDWFFKNFNSKRGFLTLTLALQGLARTPDTQKLHTFNSDDLDKNTCLLLSLFANAIGPKRVTALLDEAKWYKNQEYLVFKFVDAKGKPFFSTQLSDWFLIELVSGLALQKDLRGFLAVISKHQGTLFRKQGKKCSYYINGEHEEGFTVYPYRYLNAKLIQTLAGSGMSPKELETYLDYIAEFSKKRHSHPILRNDYSSLERFDRPPHMLWELTEPYSRHQYGEVPDSCYLIHVINAEISKEQLTQHLNALSARTSGARLYFASERAQRDALFLSPQEITDRRQAITPLKKNDYIYSDVDVLSEMTKSQIIATQEIWATITTIFPKAYDRKQLLERLKNRSANDIRSLGKAFAAIPSSWGDRDKKRFIEGTQYLHTSIIASTLNSFHELRKESAKLDNILKFFKFCEDQRVTGKDMRETLAMMKILRSTYYLSQLPSYSHSHKSQEFVESLLTMPSEKRVELLKDDHKRHLENPHKHLALLEPLKSESFYMAANTLQRKRLAYLFQSKDKTVWREIIERDIHELAIDFSKQDKTLKSSKKLNPRAKCDLRLALINSGKTAAEAKRFIKWFSELDDELKEIVHRRWYHEQEGDYVLSYMIESGLTEKELEENLRLMKKSENPEEDEVLFSQAKTIRAVITQKPEEVRNRIYQVKSIAAQLSRTGDRLCWLAESAFALTAAQLEATKTILPILTKDTLVFKFPIDDLLVVLKKWEPKEIVAIGHAIEQNPGFIPRLQDFKEINSHKAPHDEAFHAFQILNSLNLEQALELISLSPTLFPKELPSWSRYDFYSKICSGRNAHEIMKTAQAASGTLKKDASSFKKYETWYANKPHGQYVEFLKATAVSIN